MGKDSNGRCRCHEARSKIEVDTTGQTLQAIGPALTTIRDALASIQVWLEQVEYAAVAIGDQAWYCAQEGARFQGRG